MFSLKLVGKQLQLIDRKLHQNSKTSEKFVFDTEKVMENKREISENWSEIMDSIDSVYLVCFLVEFSFV